MRPHRSRPWWSVASVVAALVLLIGGVTWLAADGDEPGVAAADHPGDTASTDAGGSSSGGSVSGDDGDDKSDAGSSETPPTPEPTPSDKPDEPGEAPPQFGLALQSYAVVSPTMLRVTYAIGVPECYGRLDSTEVVETVQSVTITLTSDPMFKPKDVACPDIALMQTTTVDLDAPLAGRAVLDGATGQTVSSIHGY